MRSTISLMVNNFCFVFVNLGVYFKKTYKILPLIINNLHNLTKLIRKFIG